MLTFVGIFRSFNFNFQISRKPSKGFAKGTVLTDIYILRM